MLDNETLKLVKSLYQFMKNKYKFDKKPKLVFKNDAINATKILGKTGYYDPETYEICIYVKDRHPKDVLRSLAHELIHHIQTCEGRMGKDKVASAADENYIVHDDYLKEMEREAFDFGNITFREWEAEQKMSNKETLEEGKKKKKKSRKLTTAKYNKAKKMARSMEKKQGYSAEKAHKIAFAQVQKENVMAPIKESKNRELPTEPAREVEVNEALKDSLVYNKEDRACNDAYSTREELVFQEMLKKFGIKK